jgi:WD40 repeat protein
MTELGSRSDLETLQRSGRAKYIALGVLLAGALGAAGYSFFKRGGTGNPEDPGKVLVVTHGTRIGYSVVLKDVGFEAAEGTLPAWVNKAKDEVPDLDSDGVAAIMELADRFGWGYVAFETPADVDFSGIDIDELPTFDENTKWAVVSAGDFAFPHVVTVNPPPSKVLRDSSVPLLQALFAQEELAKLRDPKTVPVERLQLRDRVEEAMHRLDQVPQAEQMAEKIVLKVREQLTDGERSDPKPTLVGEALESASCHPLPDGNLLTVSRSIELVTRDAVRADLDLARQHRMLYGAPMAEPSTRTACTALAGGELEVGDLSNALWSPDGSTVVLETMAEGETVWRFDPSVGACGWKRSHVLPKHRAGLDGRLKPWSTGHAARVGHVDGLAVVSVIAPDGTEQVLGMIEGVQLSDLVWLDDTHLAALAVDQQGGESSLVLFATGEPMKVLVLRSTAIAGAMGLGELAAVPGRDSVVVAAMAEGAKLYRIDFTTKIAELFTSPRTLPETVPLEVPGRPTVYELDPAVVSATVLTQKGSVDDTMVSPDGKWVAYTTSGDDTDPDEDGDSEIAIAAIDGSGSRLLTRNGVYDDDPYFTKDGKHVVFETRVEMPKTDWTITAPRIVPLQ